MRRSGTLLVLTLVVVLTRVSRCATISCTMSRRDSDKTVSLPCARQRMREPLFRLTGGVKPEDVSRIQLNDNQIATIGENAFRNFSNLDVLELQNNFIESVAPGAFAGTRLTKLDLSNNRLTLIPTDALRHLPNLIELELALNLIESIPYGAFQHNSELEKIDLESNALRYIDPHTLSPLRGASTRYSPMLFNVANNSLTYLDPSMESARAFGAIKFKIVDNPWHCNCSMSFMFFKLKMRSDEVSNHEWPTCYSPLAIRGRSWERLTRMDFACAPNITDISAQSNEAVDFASASTSPPQRAGLRPAEPPAGEQDGSEAAAKGPTAGSTVVDVLEGSALHIMCRGYVDPPQDVSWAKDGQAVSFRDARIQRAMSLNGQVVWFSDNFTLHALRVNDSGTYSCSVANLAGTSELNVTVRVRERPPQATPGGAPDATDADTAFRPSQAASVRLESGASAMHYVLLVGACVGGVVLVMAVASFAFYCVKNRYLSYNAVVYRVRKQDDPDAKSKGKGKGKSKGKHKDVPQVATPNGTSHNHSNYLNFSSAIGNDCAAAAGLLLARPAGLSDSDDANATGYERNLPFTQSPDRAPYSPMGSSFGNGGGGGGGNVETRKPDASLISGRGSPMCARSRTLLHSEMVTLKRGYPQALLASPCHTVCGNNNNEQLRYAPSAEWAECEALYDGQRADAVVCSCGTLSSVAGCGSNRCKVYFASPCCAAATPDSASMHRHYVGVNSGHAFPQPPQPQPPYSSATFRYNSRLSNVDLYCEHPPTLAHRTVLDVPQVVAANYNNNLACSEPDDKSPTLSNSTNSTAMFANKTETDLERV